MVWVTDVTGTYVVILYLVQVVIQVNLNSYTQQRLPTTGASYARICFFLPLLGTERKNEHDFLFHNSWFWFLGFGDR